jgi:SAM-dependent methyltransferase
MDDPSIQTAFWDSAASSKTFTHPLPLDFFISYLPLSARILDYGCGYGRTCAELDEAGYRNVTGIDISPAMIERGKALDPHMDLRVFDGKSTGFDSGSFDLCLLVAVLNCTPFDAGLDRTMAEVRRVLRPGGYIFISDYLLQNDDRNVKRYVQFEKELGTYGMFRVDGAVFRHFSMERMEGLLSCFYRIWQGSFRTSTMNGHESDIIQILSRKKQEV